MELGDGWPGEVEARIADRHSLTFSPGNVQIHAVSVALEMHDHTRALALNARTDPTLRGSEE
jgi:hypothetical protein